MHPIVLTIGSTPITSYGLAACVGFLLAVVLTCRRAAREGWHPDLPVDVFLISTVGGVALTRIFYVVSYPAPFLQDPLLILQIWKGGITYYGGLLGAYLSAYGYCRWWGLPWGETADMFSPYLALAHAIGRVGCFLNGCCYGIATTVSWGLVFPGDRLGLHRHPTQLYEAGLEAINFLLLDLMWRRGLRGGRVTLTWFGLYALERFMLEFWRGDTLSEQYFLGTTFAQSTSLLVGLVCLVAATRVGPPDPEAVARLRAGAPAAPGAATGEGDPAAGDQAGVP